MGGTMSLNACGSYDEEPKVMRPKLADDVEEVAVKLPFLVQLAMKLGLGEMLMAPPEPGTMTDVRKFDKLANPYRFMECEVDRLWIVEYVYQPDDIFAEFIVGGMEDPATREAMIKRCSTPAEKDLARDDAIRCATCAGLTDAEKKSGGLLANGMAMANYMLVARADDGRVVLYSPVHVDDVIPLTWLREKAPLGVKAIVSPSIAHTLFVKSAKLAYPEAKVIASDVAAAKLKHVGVVADCIYSTYDGLEHAKKVLGVSFEAVVLDSDPVQELDLLYKPTKTLLTCDLFYGGFDGFGCLSEDQWKDPDFFLMRVFVRRYFSPKFAHGLVPVYRWQLFHESTGLFGAHPPQFGAPKRFHDSLAALLQKDIIRVLAAHVGFEMSIEVARQHLTKAWLSWTQDSTTPTHFLGNQVSRINLDLHPTTEGGGRGGGPRQVEDGTSSS